MGCRVDSEGSYYTAPELHSHKLHGKVYGHLKINNGDSIDTSGIVKIIDKGTHKEIETLSGSIYELHKENVDSKSEKQFLNYYERLKLNY